MNEILVIDDEIQICEMIRMIFKKNYNVIYSLEGKTGLEMFYSEKPEIIILDLDLKDISGMEVLKIIKKHSPACYVIMLTASRSDKKEALELGVDNYLNKPCGIEELKNAVLGYRVGQGRCRPIPP